MKSVTKGYVPQMLPIYIYQFFSSMFFAKSIIILYYLSLNMSLTQVGLVSSIMYLTNILLEYPTGILADKFGRKNSLYASIISQSIAGLVYGLSTNLYGIIFASMLWSLAWSFASTAR